MTGAEAIGPAIGLASKAAQGAGGKGGGGGSGNKASPEQAALAQYHYGENLLAAREATTERSNLGASTMTTQLTEGARNQFAKEMAGAADKNAALTATANQSLQQLANQNAEQQGFGAATGGATTGGTV